MLCLINITSSNIVDQKAVVDHKSVTQLLPHITLTQQCCADGLQLLQQLMLLLEQLLLLLPKS
jgi:hypothetical protein